MRGFTVQKVLMIAASLPCLSADRPERCSCQAASLTSIELTYRFIPIQFMDEVDWKLVVA
ncbi:hypothetical protein DAI22_07g057350 [Oryza sativa Japonica Group]|nr:hypothetical protein DAI22_07g057350 [Oryza sativa Japonica Group]